MSGRILMGSKVLGFLVVILTIAVYLLIVPLKILNFVLGLAASRGDD